MLSIMADASVVGRLVPSKFFWALNSTKFPSKEVVYDEMSEKAACGRAKAVNLDIGQRNADGSTCRGIAAQAK